MSKHAGSTPLHYGEKTRNIMSQAITVENIQEKIRTMEENELIDAMFRWGIVQVGEKYVASKALAADREKVIRDMAERVVLHSIEQKKGVCDE